jgi:hypothetical protein
MAADLKGTLIEILPVQKGVSKAGKDWEKLEFVIETEEQFPKKVCFTLFGDKVSLLNGVNKGDSIEVSFNIESREFNGKWYHTINAWRINKQNIKQEEVPDYNFDMPPPPDNNGFEPSYDDLPF